VTIKTLAIILVVLLACAWTASLCLKIITRTIAPRKTRLGQVLDAIEIFSGFVWLCGATIYAIII
jgi:hypothetical protein